MTETRPASLPRLAPDCYRGDAAVHWTLTIHDRQQGWLSEGFHAQFREIMLHASFRHGLLCPTYCLMPDHLHLLWIGLRRQTDQRVAMAFLRTHLGHALAPFRFQHQAYDHVLRQSERDRDALARICFYILNNPIRAERATRPGEWTYTGAIVPGHPRMHPSDPGFWERFWAAHARQHDPASDQIARPVKWAIPSTKARDETP